MDCNIIHKVKKLYRIHDALFKYNIFDKNAFDKDETFKYIIQHYDVEDDFHKMFQQKYSHEITQSNAYKEQQKQDQENNQDTTKQTDAPDTQSITHNSDDENEEVDIEEKTSNKPKQPSIKEIDKNMYKKIAFISHPDKSTKAETE